MTKSLLIIRLIFLLDFDYAWLLEDSIKTERKKDHSDTSFPSFLSLDRY